MSFLVETTDIDLGDTSIENIFINDFMPMADGTYVKVYLLGYKYAKDKDANISLNNEIISKHLNIPLSDVLHAWDFWQEKGIIKKHTKESGNDYDYEVEFLNLKQLYIKNNYRPVSLKETPKESSSSNTLYTCSVEDLIEANKVPSIHEMFDSIDYIVRRPLVPNEKRKVLEWIYNYNMNPDVIIKAFFYSVEKKGKKNINYIEGIIRNWYDMNITNVEALQEHFKSKDEKFYRYERILKSLGINMSFPNEAQTKVIDKWFNDWKFTLDVVLRACEDGSKKTTNPNINYIDGILSSWYEKGIKSVDEIVEKDKIQAKTKGYTFSSNTSSNNKKPPMKTRFHNFEQRTSKYTPEELEDIIRKRRG